MTTVAELSNKHTVQWCPGCGDFPILIALKQAIAATGLNPKDIVVVSGIGCSGKTPHYLNTYGLESLHGRGLAAATGVQLANPKLKVIAVGGDGDGLGIGLGHFIHSCRRNVNITYIIFDNMVYGLTKGQTSPTSRKGFKTSSTPHGAIEHPINPVALALAADATFVARGFSGKLEHLTNLVKEAILHKGFSFIDVLQPCISYNHEQTYEFYNKAAYDLGATKGWKADNVEKAFKKAYEWGEKIPIGIFFQEKRSTYDDELPQDKDVPVALQPIDNVDITVMYDKYL
ncbi:MAG: 2-oxoacid:ferredoxin oxidoreductase subunit beta [Nanoarchaeota archaeon]|nr:2-oxoacid:ferredoxin oxidoreductase subunit beta [Nanoarchaeota archaeon]